VLDVVEEGGADARHCHASRGLYGTILGSGLLLRKELAAGIPVGEMAMTRTVFESGAFGYKLLATTYTYLGRISNVRIPASLGTILDGSVCGFARVERLAAVGAYRCATFIADFCCTRTRLELLTASLTFSGRGAVWEAATIDHFGMSGPEFILCGCVTRRAQGNEIV